MDAPFTGCVYMSAPISPQDAITSVRDALQQQRLVAATPPAGEFQIYADMAVPVGAVLGDAAETLQKLGYRTDLEDPVWLDHQQKRLGKSQRVFGGLCISAAGCEVLPTLDQLDTVSIGELFTAQSLVIAALLGSTRSPYDPALGFSPSDVVEIFLRYPKHRVTRIRGVLERSSTNREQAKRLLEMSSRASRRPNKLP